MNNDVLLIKIPSLRFAVEGTDGRSCLPKGLGTAQPHRQEADKGSLFAHHHAPPQASI